MKNVKLMFLALIFGLGLISESSAKTKVTWRHVVRDYQEKIDRVSAELDDPKLLQEEASLARQDATEAQGTMKDARKAQATACERPDSPECKEARVQFESAVINMKESFVKAFNAEYQVFSGIENRTRAIHQLCVEGDRKARRVDGNKGGITGSTEIQKSLRRFDASSKKILNQFEHLKQDNSSFGRAYDAAARVLYARAKKSAVIPVNAGPDHYTGLFGAAKYQGEAALASIRVRKQILKALAKRLSKINLVNMINGDSSWDAQMTLTTEELHAFDNSVETYTDGIEQLEGLLFATDGSDVDTKKNYLVPENTLENFMKN